MPAKQDRVFRFQGLHALSFVLLSGAAWAVLLTDAASRSGSLWSVETFLWFLIAIVVPAVHHLYVMLVWRLELHRKTFSSRMGTEKAFRIYAVLFMILFGGRLISLSLLAVSNRQTITIHPALLYGLSFFIFLISLYVLYSVLRYFTVRRALGIDHFQSGYREPFARKGIYSFTNNGMYIYGLMFLYLPGLLMQSRAALLAALFNHFFIWGHYFFTERPDMELIYGASP